MKEIFRSSICGQIGSRNGNLIFMGAGKGEGKSDMCPLNLRNAIEYGRKCAKY
jgi:hypothetical protein